MADKHLGVYPIELAGLPAYAEGFAAYRTVAANDTLPGDFATIPDIDLTRARSGTNNKVYLLVKGGGAGVKLTLYLEDGTDYYLFETMEMQAADVVLMWIDVPAVVCKVAVSGLVGGPLTIKECHTQ